MDRKPGTHEENHELEFDAQSVQAVHDLQNKNAALQSAFSEEQRQKTAVVNQRIGRRQILTMFERIGNVTNLVDLQKIKESKEYKGLQIIVDGETRNVTTWDDYCRLVEGRSRESIDNDLLNLNAFGEEMFDSMRQVGIGPGTMRALRKLPEEDIVQIDEVVKTKDEEKIKATIQDLQEKHARERQQLAKEKEQLTKERDDARADYEAQGSRLAKVTSERDEAQMEIEKMRRRIQTAPADEVAKQLRAETAGITVEFQSLLQTKFRPAVDALLEHATASGIDHRPYLAESLRMLEVDIAVLRDTYDLDMMPNVEPDWLNADATSEAEEKIIALREQRGV